MMLKNFKAFLPAIGYLWLGAILLSSILFVAYGAQINFNPPILMGATSAGLALSLFIAFYNRRDFMDKFKENKFFRLLNGIACAGFSGYALFNLLAYFLFKVGILKIEGFEAHQGINGNFIQGILMLLLALITYGGYKIQPEKILHNLKAEYSPDKKLHYILAFVALFLFFCAAIYLSVWLLNQ